MGFLRNLFAKNPAEEKPDGRQSTEADVQQLQASRDVTGLLKVLANRENDHGVRYVAAKALIELKDPSALEPLLAGLNYEEENLREKVADALGAIGDKRAFEPLLTRLLQDRGYGVRQAATWALAKIDRDREVESLIAALRDQNPSTRANAVYALGCLRDERGRAPLAEALNDQDASVRARALTALAEMQDPRAVDPLLQIFMDPSQERDARKKAAADLALIGDARAVEPLISVLSATYVNDSTGFCMAISTALAKLGDPRAIDPMIAVLRGSRNKYLRSTIPRDLVQFQDPRILPALLDALGDLEICGDVASALADVVDSSAIGPLTGWLHHENEFVREYARRLLAQLGQPA